MAVISTSTSATSWSPDVISFAPEEALADSLILSTSTIAGEVEGDAPAVRVPYVRDAPAGFVAEGAEIDETEPDLAEAVVHTGKVAQLIRISNEQWSQDSTADQLAASVERALTRAADTAYLLQPAPTAPAVTPPAGILHTPGLVTGGEIDDNLDTLVDLVAQLEANGAKPTHVLVDPLGWAKLRKIRTATDSNVSLLGAGTSDAERYLLDLPVIVTNTLNANSGAILDSTAILSAVGDVKVATSEHKYFGSDSVALRATWRFGSTVAFPNRIGTFTITA